MNIPSLMARSMITFSSFNKSKYVSAESKSIEVQFPASSRTSTRSIVRFKCLRSGTGASVTFTMRVPVWASTTGGKIVYSIMGVEDTTTINRTAAKKPAAP